MGHERLASDEGAEASFELLVRRHKAGYEAPFTLCDYTTLVEQRNGAELMAVLRAVQAKFPSVIRDVRGIGLMIGVEFDSHERAAAVEWACFQRGLLVLEAGKTVLRISPPLVITAEEVAVGLKLFGEAVAEVAGK